MPLEAEAGEFREGSQHEQENGITSVREKRITPELNRDLSFMDSQALWFILSRVITLEQGLCCSSAGERICPQGIPTKDRAKGQEESTQRWRCKASVMWKDISASLAC